MDQPQKRRSISRRWTAEMRAAHAVRARRQHAERRGWAVQPGAEGAYCTAYRRLLRLRVPRDKILEQLRPLYAEE